jgi:repressor of nif and glnA expression
MTWQTKDFIFEVLYDKKMNTQEILTGLEKIGHNESPKAVRNHLKKMADRKQLNRERAGQQYKYWNPLMYKEELK